MIFVSYDISKNLRIQYEYTIIVKCCQIILLKSYLREMLKFARSGWAGVSELLSIQISRSVKKCKNFRFGDSGNNIIHLYKRAPIQVHHTVNHFCCRKGSEIPGCQGSLADFTGFQQEHTHGAIQQWAIRCNPGTICPQENNIGDRSICDEAIFNNQYLITITSLFK